MTSAVRLRVSEEVVARAVRGLTDRDRLICRLVWEHSVLTTDQIAEVAFDTIARCQVRLVGLHRLRMLDRFRPYRPTGSAPFHYVLGPVGATIVAAERGVDVAELGYRPERAMAWAASPRLAHLVGVNGFFTSLSGTARRSEGGAALEEWWSERQCAKAMANLVRPDGYGVWREQGRTVEFCLEYDTGSETLGRLVDKLPGYADLEAATRVRRWVLFWLARAGREPELRRALRSAPVPVATAAAASDPAGPIWLPAGEEGGRRRLAMLLGTRSGREEG
jgi:hypothetical protein